MTASYSKCLNGLCGLFLILAAGRGLSQQEQDVAAEETRPEYRPLHYLDTPVRLEPGVDPVLPEPERLSVDETAQQAAEQDPEFARRSADILAYSSLVATMESEGGAWNPDLIEELNTLGDLQQQQGDHAEAIITFDRAIHVNRINTGLNTLDQVPAVESMIDSFMALGNWEQAELYNNYLYYVQNRAYGSSDPRIIPVLDRLANWNLRAFNVGYGDSLGLRLSTAQMMFNAAARMVGTHFGRGDERFVRLLRNSANIAYLVSRNPEFMMDMDRPEFRVSQENLRARLDQDDLSGPRGYRAGQVALQEIVDYYVQETQSVFDIAEAITHLADWYLLFDRRREAWRLYREAWDLLAAEENGEQLNQLLFGQVIPIPTFQNSSTNLEMSASNGTERSSLQSDFADLSFDVTRTGSVRNVEILAGQTPENTAILGRLQREVRSSHFRPLIVDGEAVRSNENLFRYRYWY